MDPLDDQILRAMRDGRPRDFHQILELAGFSHNTLRLHLNNLVERGLITRDKMPVNGRGRPRFVYSTPRVLGRQALTTLSGSSEMVALPFGGLKRLCRFQRGGRCRKIKELCEALNCPQILKRE